MATANDIVPLLANCVRDEITHIDAFIALLKREYDLLLGSDTDAIFRIAEEKNIAARTLQKCADKRLQLIAPFSQTNARDVLKKLLAPQHKKLWQEFVATAQQAHNLNEQNGIIIKQRMQGNQRALSILLSVNQHPATYGPDGQTRARPSGRLLGSV